MMSINTIRPEYYYETPQVNTLSDTGEPVYQAHVYRKDQLLWKGTREIEYGQALYQARRKVEEFENHGNG